MVCLKLSVTNYVITRNNTSKTSYLHSTKPKTPDSQRPMKKLLVIILAAFTQLSNAQITLVGLSQTSGYNKRGTIFTISSDGSLATLYNFNEGINGSMPKGSLVQDGDGSLYGVTSRCGSDGMGTLFKFNGLDDGLTKLVDFNSHLGAGPTGSLIIGFDGALYGMTNTGGTNDVGTIFKCATDGNMTILASFNHTNGAYPLGSLKQDKEGNLYGMTRLGGENEKGVLFKYTVSGNLVVLHSFTGQDGSQPEGNITIDKDSLLYGLTTSGGSEDGGVIFRCTASGRYNLLTSMNKETGTNPNGSLIKDTNGYFYGTAISGGAAGLGTLFRLSDSGKVTVLKNFNDTNGANPMGNLTIASDGNIYGVTKSGGLVSGTGVIFKYAIASGTMESIYEFPYSSAQLAQGGLIEMSKCNDLRMATSKRFKRATARKMASAKNDYNGKGL